MSKKAFTYIELLISLTIVAVLFIPIMQLFSHSLYASHATKEMMTAINLAQWRMERIKNLNLTKEQLKAGGDDIYPGLDKEPLEMNGIKWRISKNIGDHSGLLKVQVSVFRDGQPDRPLITVVTLFEDMIWKEIKPIS